MINVPLIIINICIVFSFEMGSLDVIIIQFGLLYLK